MPEQFWKLTLTEFNDLYEGYKWREEREWEKYAQLAVWTSQTLKKGTTAKKLLGFDKQKKKTNKEETKAMLLELTAKLGGSLDEETG